MDISLPQLASLIKAGRPDFDHLDLFYHEWLRDKLKEIPSEELWEANLQLVTSLITYHDDRPPYTRYFLWLRDDWLKLEQQRLRPQEPYSLPTANSLSGPHKPTTKRPVKKSLKELWAEALEFYLKLNYTKEEACSVVYKMSRKELQELLK